MHRTHDTDVVIKTSTTYNTNRKGTRSSSTAPKFFLGGIQVNEADQGDWAMVLDNAGFNSVHMTVYARQGRWDRAELFFEGMFKHRDRGARRTMISYAATHYFRNGCLGMAIGLINLKEHIVHNLIREPGTQAVLQSTLMMISVFSYRHRSMEGV